MGGIPGPLRDSDEPLPEGESRIFQQRAGPSGSPRLGFVRACEDSTVSLPYARLSMSCGSLKSSPAISNDALRALRWPPPSSHGNVLCGRGNCIPGESASIRVCQSQHKPHATRPNLERKQLMHVYSAVTLSTLFASPPPRPFCCKPPRVCGSDGPKSVMG